MDFRFTDEQRMLADTASAFLAEVSDSATTRRAMASEAGFDSAVWQRLCEEMYWQGILVPEATGGLSLGFVDMVIALEKAGERLHASPLYATAVATVALRCIAELGANATSASAHSLERVESLLASIVDGAIVSLAHTDARSNWMSAGIGVVASASESGWLLNGEARFVPFGHAAEHLLVVALCNNTPALFVVGTDAQGVTVTRTPTMDQTRAMASLRLDGVALEANACLSRDFSGQLPAVLDIARIFVAADQVGCAQASLDTSVEYVKERVQFGRAIASFQAIKHKAADMMLKVESARSLLYYAACVADEWMAGESDAEALSEAASMVGSCAGDAAFFCAGTGIQLHGGVGITEEYDIQLYFKRARATENYLGSPADLRERVACQLLDGD